MSQIPRPLLKIQQFWAIKMEYMCKNKVHVELLFLIALNVFILTDEQKHFLCNLTDSYFKSEGILNTDLFKGIYFI